MHVNVQIRHNAQTDEKAPYYRLKESYRDVHGHVHSLIVLNIGFEPNLTVKNVQRIALALTERFKKRNDENLFTENYGNLNKLELAKADEYWKRMRDEGGIDRFDNKEAKARSEASHYVDIDSVEHTDARNVGAEWLCKQAMDELSLEDFLRTEGWTENSINTALSHLIVRTVYTPLESHRTHRTSFAEVSIHCKIL